MGKKRHRDDEPAPNTTTTAAAATASSNTHSKPQQHVEHTRFEVVWNDGCDRSIVRLFQLKKVITEQLPNMPRDYIIRVLLERNHRSMCIVQGEDVIGGICFRPFHSRGFVEIVFLAIRETHKHRGFGTRVMNQLKEHVKKEGITHFLTYADNTAIGYFVKQGFTKKKSMNRHRWEGYIKDYVRSTLMECKIIQNVDYVNLRDTLKKQRQAVLDKIASMSQDERIYPGLGDEDFATEGRIPIENIPGVKEAGWKPEFSGAGFGYSTTSTKLGQILKTIKKMKQAWPFLNPVKEEEAPGYHEIIKKPMDLGTMEKKLREGQYMSKAEFEDDFHLMIANCRSYNEAHTIYVKTANALEKKFQSLIKHV